MAIEVLLEGKLEKEQEREQLSAFLKDLCEEKLIKMEDYDMLVSMEVCPEGVIECSYEGLYVSIVAQSNIAGPGFHAFVCEVYDKIIEESGLEWEVSDPTNYYTERNFENLKYAFFYRWLKDISEYVLQQANEESNICISWPLQYYQPKFKKDMVVTPMGYLPLEHFEKGDLETLAEEFFIWNDKERNALYYRNCACNLLWKECYFSYSAMNDDSDCVANTILDYLEAAYEKDPTLPLPLKIYQELCGFVNREILVHHASEMEDKQIGYRRDVVAFQHESWNIPVDGCSEKSFDATTNSLYFMAPYQQADTPWAWLIKANALNLESKAVFIDSLVHPSEDVLESFSFDFKGGSAKAIVEDKQEYTSLYVQFISDKATLFVEYIFHQKEDLEKMKTWCKAIQYQPTYKEEKIH